MATYESTTARKRALKQAAPDGVFKLRCPRFECEKVMATLELGVLGLPGRRVVDFASYVEGFNHSTGIFQPDGTEYVHNRVRPQMRRIDYTFSDSGEPNDMRHVHHVVCSCGTDNVIRRELMVQRCAEARAAGLDYVYAPGRGR